MDKCKIDSEYNSYHSNFSPSKIHIEIKYQIECPNIPNLNETPIITSYKGYTYNSLYNEDSKTFNFSLSVPFRESKNLFMLPIYMLDDSNNQVLLTISTFDFGKDLEVEASQKGHHFAMLMVTSTLLYLVYKRVVEF